MSEQHGKGNPYDAPKSAPSGPGLYIRAACDQCQRYTYGAMSRRRIKSGPLRGLTGRVCQQCAVPAVPRTAYAEPMQAVEG